MRLGRRWKLGPRAEAPSYVSANSAPELRVVWLLETLGREKGVREGIAVICRHLQHARLLLGIETEALFGAKFAQHRLH